MRRVSTRLSPSRIERRLSASPASSGRLPRIAVAGAGWWAQGWHIPHLHRNPSVEFAAIVDPSTHPKNPMADTQSIEALGKQYGVPTFATMDEMLSDSTMKDLDGVVVCTHHAAHHEVATKAMRAGVHVLCEKPMTTDIEEAKELLAMVQETGCIFMVNNTANWRLKTKQATQMVAAGKIGEIRHGSMLFHTPLAWVFEDPANKGWNEPSGKMLGNGFGWGQLSHSFAWIYMVSGLTPAKVFSFNGMSSKTSADMYDAVSVLCTNGATISLSGVASIPGTSKFIDNRLVGTEGTLTYHGKDEDGGAASVMEGGGEAAAPLGQLELVRFDGQNEVISGFEFENTDVEGDGPESLQAFIDACAGVEYFSGADAEIGLKAVATIDALYRSALSGRAEPTFLE